MLREIRHHDLYLSLYVLCGTRPDVLTCVRTDLGVRGYFEVRYVSEMHAQGLQADSKAAELRAGAPPESEREIGRARAIGQAILGILKDWPK